MLANVDLPQALQSRTGWSDYLEIQRSNQPHVHQIEPTNHCPYDCVMCPRGRKMNRKTGFMDLTLYTKIIDEISCFEESIKAKEIELFHFGESLLHPNIDAMVGYGAARGLNMVLSVNAPQLTPDLVVRILHSKPSKIIISLDGHDQDSYQKIRGKAANYDVAIANIENVIGFLEQNDFKTEVFIRIIKLHLNESKIDLFVQRWEAKGMQVEVRPFFPWTEKELTHLGKVEKYPPGMPCPFPWQYLVIQWDGTIVGCCRDYNGVNALGNVNGSSLESIWNSMEYSRFRDQHRHGVYKNNLFCEECMDIFYTPPIQKSNSKISICSECCNQQQGKQYSLNQGWVMNLHLSELYPIENKTEMVSLGLMEVAALFWIERICCVSQVAKKLNISESNLEHLLKPLVKIGALANFTVDFSLPPDNCLEHWQTFPLFWEETQRKYSQRPLLFSDNDDSVFTYADASDVVDMIIVQLFQLGVEKGDKIVVWSPQHLEVPLICWAALIIGATIVPLDPDMDSESLQNILTEIQPIIIFTDYANFGQYKNNFLVPTVILDEGDECFLPNDSFWFAEWLKQDVSSEKCFNKVTPEDPAVILYTSGTSDQPKGVVLSQEALLNSGFLIADSYKWNSEDILLSLGEFHTMSGFRNPCVACLHSGSGLVVASSETRRNCLVVASCIQQHQVTLLGAVPETLRHFNRFKERTSISDLSSLRHVICTGSNLTQEVQQCFTDHYDIPVYNYYGLTETAGFCIGVLPESSTISPGSIGWPHNCITRVADGQGNPVEPNHIGELFIYSPNLMTQYYNAPELTESVMLSGWYRTFDLARREIDDSITLCGRADDAIKNSRGELSHPGEVETILEKNKNIEAAGVCGYTDQKGQQYFAAFVIPKDEEVEAGLLIFDIKKWLLATRCSLESIKLFRIVKTLPRGVNGKLLRRKLICTIEAEIK